ncbi:MAG: tetratricopeptide repeat protein [Treponema sp.]|jgi:tetratricopeptide (TPR) repeat protein|nr:tetratricopeptide repeat protein [Treponema sp.]
MKTPLALSAAALIFCQAAALSCRSFGASAEEYYSIGMAYFEIGKYEEAERWLSRARSAGRTRIASEYNLGRIAFETGRYEDAAEYFETVLERDPDNVMALRALAYTWIMSGELAEAERLYGRVAALVPDNADDGYNHALVLYAMEKYAAAEDLILSRPHALENSQDMLLLFARIQRALGKVEAADSYAQWLASNNDSRVRYEYARVLEDAELYARALEEYQAALGNLPPDSAKPTAAEVRFSLARVYLTADSGNPQGLTELKAAVEGGFADREELEALSRDGRLDETSRAEIQELLKNLP